MKREDNQSKDTTTTSQITTSSEGARWKYEDISLELTAHLIRGQARYAIPTYTGEGWGHVHLKVVIAAHLLHWGYKWDDILWEYDPPDITGRRRADIFVMCASSMLCRWSGFEDGGMETIWACSHLWTTKKKELLYENIVLILP